MAAHGIQATRAPRREMGPRGSWGTRMSTRRPSGRAVTERLAVGGSWAYARSRLGVTAPALLLVSQALNEMPRCLLIAAVAILGVRAVVAVLQEAAATSVALFSNDDVRAERALQVLDRLLRRDRRGTSRRVSRATSQASPKTAVSSRTRRPGRRN
jgi:hypothetical protein